MAINKGLDVLKFTMSIMIVMIHVGWAVSMPIVRVAVPVFFIISSYFFFSRQSDNRNANQSALRKFINRGSKLYLFWFILLLPVTIYVSGWYKMTMIDLLKTFVYDLLFSNTFPTSWYISAYIIGVSIVFFLKKYLNVFVIVSLCLYILCCIASNYNQLFGITHFEEAGGYVIYNSFPVGLLFICYGVYFSRRYSCSKRASIIWVTIGFILLMTENFFINRYGWREGRHNDCYLSLIILAPAIFSFVKFYPDLVKFSTTDLRKYSTIIYCSHYSFIIIVKSICKHIFHCELQKFVLFSVVLVLCFILSILLVKISRHKSFSWVRYSF